MTPITPFPAYCTVRNYYKGSNRD